MVSQLRRTETHSLPAYSFLTFFTFPFSFIRLLLWCLHLWSVHVAYEICENAWNCNRWNERTEKKKKNESKINMHQHSLTGGSYSLARWKNINSWKLAGKKFTIQVRWNEKSRNPKRKFRIFHLTIDQAHGMREYLKCIHERVFTTHTY